MDSSVSPKDEICFLHVCHHISNAVYYYYYYYKSNVRIYVGLCLVSASSTGCPFDSVFVTALPYQLTTLCIREM